MQLLPIRQVERTAQSLGGSDSSPLAPFSARCQRLSRTGTHLRGRQVAEPGIVAVRAVDAVLLARGARPQRLLVRHVPRPDAVLPTPVAHSAVVSGGKGKHHQSDHFAKNS